MAAFGEDRSGAGTGTYRALGSGIALLAMNIASSLSSPSLRLAKVGVENALEALWSLDFRSAEEGLHQQADQLISSAQAALAASGDALALCIDACSIGQPGSDDDEPPSGVWPIELRQLEDTASVGRMMLGGLIEQVATSDGDLWERLDRIDHARNEALQSLRAADRDLCKLLGQSPDPANHLREAVRAQRVRALFIQLGRAVDVASRPSVEQLAVRLRRTGNALAVLFNREGYDHLRVHERRQLRQLHRRVHAWLLSQRAGDENAAQDGAHLWQDIVGIVEMLLGVNNRPELIEADQLALTRALGSRDTSRWDEPSTLGLLRSVQGRDAELDELLERDDCLRKRREAVVERVEAVLSELGGKASP